VEHEDGGPVGVPIVGHVEIEAGAPAAKGWVAHISDDLHVGVDGRGGRAEEQHPQQVRAQGAEHVTCFQEYRKPLVLIERPEG